MDSYAITVRRLPGIHQPGPLPEAASTKRVRRGSPWVLISNPEHIKLIFTTGSAQVRAGAGEANPLLEPLLGARSVMLLDEPQHLSDRRRLLPSFHGARMRDYGAMIGEIAERQVASWPPMMI